MGILKNKKFQIGIATTTIAAMLCAGVLCFNTFSNADKANTATVTGANDYASTFRDTSIGVDANGVLEITRNEQKGEIMGKENAWTLFVYMTGSDLESHYENATKDIKEMFAANYGKEDLDKLQIVIQTGGSRAWHLDNINKDLIQRFVVEGNELKEVENHPLASMGDASTLYSFLNWGVKNYASEHMGVIFWNHGSGVSQGLCVDMLHDNDTLTLGEVEYAFAKLNSKMTDKFELIGFDTCLSGSIEYANVLAPYAKYMVASADSEPGDGWNYTPIVNHIVGNPDSTGLDVGKVIADSYTEYYNNFSETKDFTTMAVYDLSKVDKALIETNYFAKYINELLTNDVNAFDNFAKLIQKGYTYQKLNLDMGSLLKSIDENSYFDYNTTFFRNAINDLICYKRIGNDFEQIGCNGITLYLPTYSLSLAELNMYRNAGFSPYWLNVLEYIVAKTAYDGMKNYIPNNWQSSEYFFEDTFAFIPYDDTSLYTNDAYCLINKNPDYNEFLMNWYNVFNVFNNPSANPFGGVSLEISRNNVSTNVKDSSNISNIYGSVFATIDNELVCLGENADVKYDKTTGEVISNFNGEWFTLPDGQLLTTYVISKDIDKVVYGFPVMIGDIESTIRIEETIDNNSKKHYSLLGVWDATDNSSYAPRGFLPLTKGTKITPIYDVFNTETNTYESSYGEEYTIQSDFDFLFTNLEDGTYGYSFTIDRTFGDDILTSISDFNVVNGTIKAK